MSLTDITQKLNGVRKSQSGFIAVCPAHDDKKQSLKIDDRGGKVLLNCFAGCPPAKIVEALGVEWKDLFDTFNGDNLKSRSFSQDGVGFHCPPRSKVVAVYRYTDENGDLLYENVRFEPKGFGQRRYDEKNNPVWNLTGVRRVPYRLPQLKGNKKGADVWLSEGEKDADSLAELGFTASSFKNWSRDFNKFIGKTHVVLTRDHDVPGGVQADEAARLISEAAGLRRMVDIGSCLGRY